MALPKSTETERTRHLLNVVNASSSDDIMAWPKVTDEDLALFGRIAHIYSSIDFALRYTAEVMDTGGMLPAQWEGKTAKLNMSNMMKAIRSCGIWTDNHNVAFDMIEEHRRARNLVAHFIVRRFPTEEAFMFMTKSAADFERVYGVLPPADTMLFGVTDATQMRGIIPVLLGLVGWVSKLPGNLSNPLEPNVGAVAAPLR